jgi:TRAP-type C4-dicarboxylate transport system substrate-binding protein
MLRRIAGLLVFGYMAVGQAQAQVVQLKASTYTPPAHYLTQFWTGVVKEMNEAAKGKAAVELYHSEALGKSTEQWDIVREGLADMSFTISALFYPARFTSSMFVELPFFCQNVETSTNVIDALVRKNLITKEFDEVRLLAAYNTPPAQLFSNKPLAKLDDFKGLRVVGQGPVWTRTWSLLGAQSVAMGWPDIYLALDRKTVDAAPGNWAASRGWKWAEVTKHPIEIGIMGGFFNAAVVNHQSWKKLPPDVQTAWTKIMAGAPARIAKLANENEDVGRKAARDLGREILIFPPAEREKVAAKLVPIWQEWVTRNEKANKPAKEIYRTYLDVMKSSGETVVIKLPEMN